jgi:hypothetical protein
MKEEKTQGIHTETTTKDSYDTNKKAKETELLDLRAGYCQHTSPHKTKGSEKANVTSAALLKNANNPFLPVH